MGPPRSSKTHCSKRIGQPRKVLNRDTVKLREPSDILRELECAKQDGALSGLSYLDTARGVKQIVEKLPYNLQDKWISFGSKYKEDYRVAFPPFSVFLKIKNYPSFTITPNSSRKAYKVQ